MAKRYSAILSVIFVGIVIAASLGAQAPDTLWTRAYSSSGGQMGYSIRQALDGGFIIGGVGGSSLNGLLLKTDPEGDSLWSYGDYAPYGSAYNCVLQAPDSTIMAVGWVHGLGGLYSSGRAFTFSGNYLWPVYFPFDGWEGGYTWVDNAPDGCFIFSDYVQSYDSSNADIRVIKTDSMGNELWTRTYGDSVDEFSGAIRPDVEGGFIVAGGNGQGFIVKIDENGDTLWSRAYGGTGYDSFHDIIQAADSGYLAVGTTYSFGHGGSDMWLVKMNCSGDTTWTRTFGTAGNDYGNSIDKGLDGGFIIAGVCYDTEYYRKAYLIRISDNGDTMWTKVVYPFGSSEANSVIALPDGGFAFTGWISPGDTVGPALWIVRLAQEIVGINESGTQIAGEMKLAQNHPNPFNKSTMIEFQIPDDGNLASLKVYDLCGRLVSTLFDNATAGKYRCDWNGHDEKNREVSSGIYVYRLQSGSFTLSRKMLLIR